MDTRACWWEAIAIQRTCAATADRKTSTWHEKIPTATNLSTFSVQKDPKRFKNSSKLIPVSSPKSSNIKNQLANKKLLALRPLILHTLQWGLEFPWPRIFCRLSCTCEATAGAPRQKEGAGGVFLRITCWQNHMLTESHMTSLSFLIPDLCQIEVWKIFKKRWKIITKRILNLGNSWVFVTKACRKEVVKQNLTLQMLLELAIFQQAQHVQCQSMSNKSDKSHLWWQYAQIWRNYNYEYKLLVSTGTNNNKYTNIFHTIRFGKLPIFLSIIS